MAPLPCKICGTSCLSFESGIVLEKHPVSYFHCTNCGFVFTTTPYWLDEAYSEVINQYDIGLLCRNRQMVIMTRSIINAFLDGGRQFLDYGGGYGVFVRMMRDEGFDFYRYDPMCRNLFAEGYDLANAPDARFETVTAFEVFEHLVDPLAEIEKILAYTDTIIFSTALVPTPPPALRDWWYYGTEHGQHIAFYTLESLRAIARRFSLNVYTNYGALHILSARSLPAWRVKAIFHNNPLYRTWVNFRHRRHSLLLPDAERLKRPRQDVRHDPETES